ncbi:recognition of pollen [Spatholobus suberectus]|nr:recognition of pollen [Spatholobus suberectus]
MGVGNFVSTEEEKYYIYDIFNKSTPFTLVLAADGFFKANYWSNEENDWRVYKSSSG